MNNSQDQNALHSFASENHTKGDCEQMYVKEKTMPSRNVAAAVSPTSTRQEACRRGWFALAGTRRHGRPAAKWRRPGHAAMPGCCDTCSACSLALAPNLYNVFAISPHYHHQLGHVSDVMRHRRPGRPAASMEARARHGVELPGLLPSGHA